MTMKDNDTWIKLMHIRDRSLWPLCGAVVLGLFCTTQIMPGLDWSKNSILFIFNLIFLLDKENSFKCFIKVVQIWR